MQDKLVLLSWSWVVYSVLRRRWKSHDWALCLSWSLLLSSRSFKLPFYLIVECLVRGGWFAIERPSKREVLRSLWSVRGNENETVEQDVERDYNKLARHPKGNFGRTIWLRKFSTNLCANCKFHCNYWRHNVVKLGMLWECMSVSPSVCPTHSLLTSKPFKISKSTGWAKNDCFKSCITLAYDDLGRCSICQTVKFFISLNFIFIGKIIFWTLPYLNIFWVRVQKL